MIDRFPMGQIVGDHSPRNTAPHNIEDRVEDFALRVGAWSAASRHVCFRDYRSNDFPLRIRQTAWITRHAEFLPDLGTKVQPNICLKLFFRQALSAFSNSCVTIFKTTQPIKAYRCFSSNPAKSPHGPSGGFLMFEKPVHRTQVEVDQALGTKTGGFILKNDDGSSAYDRFVEIEIPSDVYVYMGIVADQGGKFKGGGTQFWVDDLTRDAINWNVSHQLLPQH
jgi:hypothetical protein